MCIISATTAKRLIGHHRFEFAHKGKQFFFNANHFMQSFYHFSSVRRLSATYALKAHPLRLPQVLEDQLHLPSREVAVIDTVARGEQRGQQAVGVVDVTVEATQRVRGRPDREVHRGEFTLGVGTDYHN